MIPMKGMVEEYGISLKCCQGVEEWHDREQTGHAPNMTRQAKNNRFNVRRPSLAHRIKHCRLPCTEVHARPFNVHGDTCTADYRLNGRNYRTRAKWIFIHAMDIASWIRINELLVTNVNGTALVQ